MYTILCVLLERYVFNNVLIESHHCSSAGKLNMGIALNMTHYLSNEEDYLPWMSALHWIYKMSSLLSLTPVYGMYEVR